MVGGRWCRQKLLDNADAVIDVLPTPFLCPLGCAWQTLNEEAFPLWILRFGQSRWAAEPRTTLRRSVGPTRGVVELNLKFNNFNGLIDGTAAFPASPPWRANRQQGVSKKLK